MNAHATGAGMFGHLGPYMTVFDRGELPTPGYLCLLHCASDDVGIVLDRIQEATKNDPEYKVAEALFAADNWRPHLVACAIALSVDDLASFPDWIWSAFDSGSWVSPQLAVTASLKDPNFLDQAKWRLERLCPTTYPVELWLGADPPPGPTFVDTSGKGVSSLHHLCAHRPEMHGWLDRYKQRPDVRNILAYDEDNASNLVANWSRNVIDQFSRRGRTLG